MLRVLFAGTPEVAVPSLRMLAKDTEHFEVVAVLTRPDAPTGRGRKIMPSPVKMAARELGLDVIECDPADECFLSALKATGAQCAAVVAYGKILRESGAGGAAAGMVQPAFLAAAAVAWCRSGSARDLGWRRSDRMLGVPHHCRYGSWAGCSGRAR